jgi:hypothetical protein
MKNLLNKIISIIFDKPQPTLLGFYLESVTNESWISGMNRTGQVSKYISYK